MPEVEIDDTVELNPADIKMDATAQVGRGVSTLIRRILPSV